MRHDKFIIFLLILSLLISLFVMTSSSKNIDAYHSSIGGGSPGFVRYAIRGGSCGCGFRPDGLPYCDLTGPISYENLIS